MENAPLLEGGQVGYLVLQIVGYIALAGVAALVASVIPARRAARLTVIDGLAADLSPARRRNRARQRAVDAMSTAPAGVGAIRGTLTSPNSESSRLSFSMRSASASGLPPGSRAAGGAGTPLPHGPGSRHRPSGAGHA